MASPRIPQGGSFSLFPNTTATTTSSPPRRQTPRPSTSSSSPVENLSYPIVIPGPYANSTQSPPPQRRPTPQARVASPAQAQEPPRQWGPSRAESSTPAVQQPRQAADVPGRSETAFSQAQTLVLRSASTRSRSSIAKKPLDDEQGGDEGAGAIRSMFPRYNPEVPLNQQSYYPTARSPTHIPRAVISRPMYSPEPVTPSSPPPPIDAALTRAPVAAQQWPPATGPHAVGPPPPLPTVSSTDELKGLWKVTNGWKASQSEGTVFCLKMTQERDAPVCTLSSTGQAFYNLRVDPTSASAYVTLSRHDPSKACRGPPPTSAVSPTTPSSIRSRKSQAKIGWHEVLSTALEEEPRRHRPNDGLVAELCPAAAIRMAIDRPEDEGAAVLAEQECARLVWDDDSASHYLVHPALATPFCVTAERHPAWGRVEYTLEHHESPNHLARLTREANGVGYLEVDTGLASKIESFFVLDVAVAALLIVASADKAFVPTESFEPPPPAPARAAAAAVVPDGFGAGDPEPAAPPKAARKWGRKTKMVSMEIQDVESQESYAAPKAKKRRVKGDRIRDGLPWPIRIAVTPGIWLGKAALWCITTFLKVVVWMVKGLAKALGLIGTTK